MSPPGDSRKTVQESRRNLKTRHPELARCKRAGEGPNVGSCYQYSLATPNLVRLGAQLCFDYAEWNASHMRSLSRPLAAGAIGMTSAGLNVYVQIRGNQQPVEIALTNV